MSIAFAVAAGSTNLKLPSAVQSIRLMAILYPSRAQISKVSSPLWEKHSPLCAGCRSSLDTAYRTFEMAQLKSFALTTQRLRIYKTYHRKKGQDIFGPTKNSKKGGNRNVPIPHWLAEEFRTYCSRLYGLTPDDRVFYMTCTALNKELTRCTQLTYLPDIRVHDLRHSHVSLCIELGYSVVLVARRIGDTVPVVMRTYAHLYPNKQQELVSKLEAIGSPSSNDDESDLMSLG